MLPGESRIICMDWDMLPGLDLCDTDSAQYLITAGCDRDDLDRDLSEVIFQLSFLSLSV